MITPAARLRRLTAALLALVLIFFSAPWNATQAVRAQLHGLFLAVADVNGDPVSDLSLGEVVVLWDGLECDTFDLEPINRPVRVTVFVDNAEGSREALQHMREGLKGFLDVLPGEVEVALVTLARQPRWVTRHTSDRTELARGIDLITPDNGTRARFRDALYEEAERLNDDLERQYVPVIVMVATDGPEGSTLQQVAYERMAQRLVDNSATVHTLLFSNRRVYGRGQQVQIAMHLRDLTGGTYESLAIPSGFRRLLPELAGDIARKHRLTSHQYRVTYTPPAGTFDRPRISISTSRPNLNLFPTFDGNVR